MARPRRISIPGVTHHVRHRGNTRCDMFRARHDYELYLYAMAESCTRFDVAVHGYTLMTNHVHLFLTPKTETGIAQAMQHIGRRYVPYFNMEYGRCGTLFDGRYRSCLVEWEDYWYTCLRYIELNPVRAGLVRVPEDYRWSSYRAHALGEEDQFLTLHDAYLELGATPETRQRVWRGLCEIPLQTSELDLLRESIKKQKTLSRPVEGV